MGIIRVGKFPVGVFLGRSCLGRIFPGGSFPEWELSGREFSWVAIVQVGLILGENYFWSKFSGWELSGGNHPGGNFPGGSFHVTINSILQ